MFKEFQVPSDYILINVSMFEFKSGEGEFQKWRENAGNFRLCEKLDVAIKFSLQKHLTAGLAGRKRERESEKEAVLS